MPISFTELHSPQLKSTFQFLHLCAAVFLKLGSQRRWKAEETEPTQAMLILHSSRCSAALPPAQPSTLSPS